MGRGSLLFVFHGAGWRCLGTERPKGISSSVKSSAIQSALIA